MILREAVVLGKSRSSSLEYVTHLNLWGNELADISVFLRMKRVKVVSLSINKIRSLKDFRNCEALEELYLRKNSIQDLSEIRYLQPLNNLRVLWLSDNPCATETDYRMKVLSVLPNLTKIDATNVTPEEKEMGMERYRSFRSFVMSIKDEDEDEKDDNMNIRKENEKVMKKEVYRPPEKKFRSQVKQQQQQYHQPYKQNQNRREGGGFVQEKRSYSNNYNERKKVEDVNYERKSQRRREEIVYEPPPQKQNYEVNQPRYRNYEENVKKKGNEEILDLPEPPPFEEFDKTLEFPHEEKKSSGGDEDVNVKRKESDDIDVLISRNNIFNGVVILMRELDLRHLEKLQREIKNLKRLKKKN